MMSPIIACLLAVLQAGDLSDSRRTAIVTASEQAGPSVVSISVTQVVQRYVPLQDPFFDFFFRGGYTQRRYEVHSMGSGFIVSADGLVLTNQHVIEGATAITVTLPDGREFPGKVSGSDDGSDLAVLKVEGKALPVAELGDSDDLLIGEWAIAIGNPFGYLLDDPQPSVTAGVISATHRDIKPERGQTRVYRDLIQTDAAINPGNSGGPLVDSRGKVVGINTFIFSSSGGSLGMGFAIPINRAKQVMDELVSFGRTRDVYTGIRVQEITRLLALSLGLDSQRGVLVSEVERGSPAAKAGLQPGDVIRRLNARPILSIEDARSALAGLLVNDTLQVVYEREGQQRETAVILAPLPG
ncbi:MAG: trypsin-like peptidase domain-containing protein [Candidatus Eisenbacteria bacterium]|jgi:serine protease Do|nr:trypsin-like peptidase domain-containing protein [Candidatus Eisenbacteria bacterium]